MEHIGYNWLYKDIIGYIEYNTGYNCGICKMPALAKSVSAECYCSSPLYQQ